jgi:hypothetical protein
MYANAREQSSLLHVTAMVRIHFRGAPEVTVYALTVTWWQGLRSRDHRCYRS